MKDISVTEDTITTHIVSPYRRSGTAFLRKIGNHVGQVLRLDKRLFAKTILWLKDESLEASDNLPDPDVIAQEIVEDLEAALEPFREIVGDLDSEGSQERKG